MSRRLFVAAAILVWSVSSLAVNQASAQSVHQMLPQPKLLFLPSDSTAPVIHPATAETPAANAAPAVSDVDPIDAPQLPMAGARAAFGRSPSKDLLPLYASTALLQILDVHSTMQVLKQGGGEGNPMLQGLVQHQAAFIATKAAIGAATMYAASRIAKRNKIGAIITLVGINSVYAFVVSHNYKLAHELR